MSKSGRRDGDRRPGDRGDRRDAQPDDEQQRRPGDPDLQESDSLTALKAILAKVAALLAPLKLTQEESISLVEQLYGSVLAMDVKLAGETDDKRKASVLAHIQNTQITRTNGKLAVDYPKEEAGKPATASAPKAPAAPEAAAAGETALAPEAAPAPEAVPAEPAPAPEQTKPVEPAPPAEAATPAAADEEAPETEV